MPSFRAPNSQARHLVSNVSTIGVAKNDGDTTHVHSLGSLRTCAVSIGLFTRWLADHRLAMDARTATCEQAFRWLEERSEEVAQKCLDNDRQAVVRAFGFNLPRLRSTYESERKLAAEARAYMPVQVERILAHQSPRNAFATRVIQAAGLRAHEPYTLLPPHERAASAGRDWRPDRFLGMKGVRYTVQGKGGLVREVVLPDNLAGELERKRRTRPLTVRDREINYATSYDVAGGNAWSKSFTLASKRALGYSSGGHGLRHSYAQTRMECLQRAGLTYDDAIAIVSQELGHFRPDITEIYLR